MNTTTTKTPSWNPNAQTRVAISLAVSFFSAPVGASAATQPLTTEDQLVALGAAGAAVCNVVNGDLTLPAANSALASVTTSAAYDWLSTPDGSAAIRAVVPYVSDDCQSFTATPAEFNESIKPYVF